MTSISTPTQLATFSQPHASSSKTPHVTLNPVIGDSGCAVAAVRGDGIWTYDLNTLRPTTSFTVPPSTVFSTSPISYWVTRTRTITSSAKEKLPENDVPRVIEVMDVDDADEDDEELVFEPVDEDEEEDLDLDVEGEEDEVKTIKEKERTTMVGVGKEIWLWRGDDGDKEILSIDKSIQSIHYLQSKSYPILVIPTNPTDLYLLDDSLKPHHLSLPSSSSTKATILTSKILSSSETTARLIIVDQEGQSSVYKLHLESTLRAEGVVEGKIGNKGKLTFVDISEDGFISAIDEENNLYTKEISSLTSTTSTSPLKVNHPSSTPVILSLPTKGKPVILLPTSYPTPSLLSVIPLSNLPAILTSSSISSFTSSGSINHLSILLNKNGLLTVGIVLSHLNSDGESGRSVIYTTEVVIPEKGIGISMLLNTKEKTQIYLSSNQDQNDNGNEKVSVEKEQDEIINKISSLIQKNDLKTAEKTLQNFISVTASTNITESFVRKVISTVFSIALNDEGKVKGSYASGIIKYLVERDLVNDSMWKDSLVGMGLLPCGDWDTIIACLQKFRTIPSSTLVKLITSSIHPSETAKSIPLSQMLSLIMKSPPAPTFRLDIRQNLSIEDASVVLQKLVEWVEEYVTKRDESLLEWDNETETVIESNQSNSVVDINGNEEIPTLKSIIEYSTLLLDSHLPSFLTYEPSYELLEILSNHLEPLIELQNQYKKLKGPIEAILILSKRENDKLKQREQQQKSKLNKKNNNITTNDKKIQQQQQKENRLPEEKIGKWKVEDLVF
ncbi:uncharacterized protein L201_004802 [Kwoniella dendrophila CBS 6074]|uniref:Uncharacterized protein n=1 Tax=Kwoniella dendrophila CBS 6074 TaxID=1295534 RepID=A0AAX4JYE0_9TREE